MSFMGNPGSGSNTPGYPDQGPSHHQSHSMGGNPGYADSSYGSQGPIDDSPLITKREGNVRRGVCKFFNSQKGFGFVLDNNAEELGGQEVFVHFTAIQSRTGFRSLAEGEEVEYEITTGPKGFQATRLTGPGGRPVVGDPKARLMKQPQGFMQLAPIAFPGPYGMDPYIQQHPGAVYAASPYTSHVLYVPSNMHPGQQGSYPGASQFSPSMGSGSFQGSGRGMNQQGQQGMQHGPGQFNATPQGTFGPVGGMASTMGGYQPASGFQGQSASTYTGGGGNGGSRYSAALSGGGGPPSNYGRGTPSGAQDDYGGMHSGHGDDRSGDQQGAGSSSGGGSSSAFFGSGNLLYSTN